MAVVFLLGPGMWGPDKGATTDTPIAIRREMARILREGGHQAILIEDDADRECEDIIRKFDRLLRSSVTDVVLYWPPLARMQTTFDELILLCDRKSFLQQEGISIWALHHVSVAEISKGEFKILESGNRSRYLMAVARLGIHPLEWKSDGDLMERVRLLSAQLDR